MRSFFATSIFLLSAVLPVFVDALPSGGLEARAVAGKHHAHAERVRRSAPVVRRRSATKAKRQSTSLKSCNATTDGTVNGRSSSADGTTGTKHHSHSSSGSSTYSHTGSSPASTPVTPAPVSSGNNQTNTTTPAPQTNATAPSTGSNQNNGTVVSPLPAQNNTSPGQLIQNAQPCQGIPVGAQVEPSATTGPNGQTIWGACGLSTDSPDSVWSPPTAAIEDLVWGELTSEGVFAPCAQYIPIFQAAAAKYGLPEILLAAIALQESSCQADAVAIGGTWGLFQISQDKCNGQDQSACMDPTFNTDAGASYFADTYSSSSNNVFIAMGVYNGWTPGQTSWNSITSAPCGQQQNPNYFQQTFNGYAQGQDGSAMGFFPPNC